MDFKDIKKIVELMDQHGLSEFKLSENETNLELKKGNNLEIDSINHLLQSGHYSAPAINHHNSQVSQTSIDNSSSLDNENKPASNSYKEINSPMVGTFYTSSSPDSDPFVKAGSDVKEDTTVCIIEAMKVMNEISADIEGEIVEVLVENGTAVQFGEPLFRVK